MRRLVVSGLAVAVLTACNALIGLNERDPFPDAGADAGADDATMADALGDGSGLADGGADAVGDAGGDAVSDAVGDSAACSGSTYYVSPSGLDTNPGCSPAQAKRTIAAGIAAAKAGGATGPTIKVCAGTYAETNLQLTFAASLLGGYDCTGWDGGPGPIDAGASATIIQNASSATQAATLYVLGAATKVEGFTIEGGASPVTDGGVTPLSLAALAVYGPGSPTIEENTLVGGSGAGGSPASAGLIVDGASPIINGNVIRGGSGVSTGTNGNLPPASAGIVVENGAAPTIENNVISGGSGASAATNGSAGIEVQGSSGAVTITGNTVNGGSGSVTGATTFAFGSAALHMAGPSTSIFTHTVRNNAFVGGQGSTVSNNASADAVRAVWITMGTASLVFEGNSVDGTDELNDPGGITTGGSCARAVEVDGSIDAGTVLIAGNRIYGGTCSDFLPSLNATNFQFGLFTQGPFASLTIENNMIHGGSVGPSRWGAALVLGNGTAVARHNTLVAALVPTDLTYALWLRTAPVADVVENNVLAGVGPSAFTLQVDTVGACAKDGGAAPVASFQNNLLFGTTAGTLRTPCGLPANYATLDGLTATLAASGASVGGNVIVQGSCAASDGGTVGGCVTLPCAGAPDGGPQPDGGCLDTIFAGWDDTTTGAANLLGGGAFEGGCPAGPPEVVGGVGVGWPLSASGAVPCSAARSSLGDVAGEGGVPLDLYGNCRGPKPTMGAAELAADASCK